MKTILFDYRFATEQSMHSKLGGSPRLDTNNMDHLQPKAKCDTCSTTFENVDELGKHKKSHLASGTPNMADASIEEIESEDLAEEQRNDHANNLVNRILTEDHRDNFWEVNPDQTPKQAKTIRPIDSV